MADNTLEFDLRVVGAGYFDELVRGLVNFYLPPAGRPSDIMRCLELCLEKLSTGDSMQMLLGEAVLYLKQHFSLLRHGGTVGEKVHIVKAHDRLLKLLRALSDMIEYQNIRIHKLLDTATSLYREYTTVCFKHGIEIPVNHMYLTTGETPQNQDMKWYRSKKLHTILRDSHQISFTAGKYRDIWCEIIRINGNNTCCLFPNGEKHYIPNTIPLIHRPKVGNSTFGILKTEVSM